MAARVRRPVTIVLIVFSAVVLLALPWAVRTCARAVQPTLTMHFNMRITEERRESTATSGLYSFGTVGLRFPLARVTTLEKVELADQSGQFTLVSAWALNDLQGFTGDAPDLDGTGRAHCAVPLEGYRPQLQETWLLLQLRNEGAGPNAAERAGPFMLRIRYRILGLPMTSEFGWD